MRSPTLFAGMFSAVLSAFAVSAMAHHSLTGTYDFSKTITLTGTIAKVRWQNPHIAIDIDAKDPADGKTVPWIFTTGSAFCMEKRGIAKESLAVGSAVTVGNAPVAKNGSHLAFLGSVSDGNRTVPVDNGPGTLELKSVFDRRPAPRDVPLTMDLHCFDITG